VTAPSFAVPAPRTQGRLLRVLGIAFGLAVIVGNTIGQGILRTPGEVAAHLPDRSLFLLAWILGGVYALLGAVSLAELGAMIPQSGGQYVFVRRALGEYPGFVVGWSDWVSSCGTMAAIAIVVGEYSPVLAPALAGREILTASAAVIGFGVLQWQGVRWGDAAQQLTTLLKTIVLVALVAACFLLGASPAQTSAINAPTGLALLGALTLALQSVIVTYDGWTGVIYFSEEVRDPGRSIPRSMLTGVLTVIAIYLLLNLAFLHVLPLERMAGEKFVAGAAAATLFGTQGDQLIRGLMIVSLLSSLNANQLMASRVPFAMSRDGLLPPRLQQVNRGGTPTMSLLASTLAAVLMIVTGSFNQVLALLAFFYVLMYLFSLSSVFVLRWREPDTHRPYRVWGYPWSTGLALLGSAAFLAAAVAGDTRNSLCSIVLLGLSYPVYLLVKRYRWNDTAPVA
jgi:basic amino acid/polyamine antiporter, APA family